MKKVLYIGIGLAVLGLIAFVLTNNKKKNEAETAVVAQKNASVSVKADTIKKESVSTDFIANGSFAPLQELSFSAENAGRVTKVLVKEGSVVRIGQTLAVIKADKISVDVQSAKASYQNALADSQRFENAAERYDRLLREKPEIILRAPMVHIASFLQMTPETLSRVRGAATSGTAKNNVPRDTNDPWWTYSNTK